MKKGLFIILLCLFFTSCSTLDKKITSGIIIDKRIIDERSQIDIKNGCKCMSYYVIISNNKTQRKIKITGNDYDKIKIGMYIDFSSRFE